MVAVIIALIIVLIVQAEKPASATGVGNTTTPAATPTKPSLATASGTTVGGIASGGIPTPDTLAATTTNAIPGGVATDATPTDVYSSITIDTAGLMLGKPPKPADGNNWDIMYDPYAPSKPVLEGKSFGWALETWPGTSEPTLAQCAGLVGDGHATEEIYAPSVGDWICVNEQSTFVLHVRQVNSGNIVVDILGQ